MFLRYSFSLRWAGDSPGMCTKFNTAVMHVLTRIRNPQHSLDSRAGLVVRAVGRLAV